MRSVITAILPLATLVLGKVRTSQDAFGTAGVEAADATGTGAAPFPWGGGVNASNSSASVARRQLHFSSGPLPASIFADGTQLLSDAARVDVGAGWCTWTNATLVAPANPAAPTLAAVWHSSCVRSSGVVVVSAVTTLHYDGWLTCDLDLEPQAYAIAVAVVLPMRKNLLFNHGMVSWNSDWNGRFNSRNSPDREWWSGAVASDFNLTFTPQLWLGDGQGRGIAFLCDGPTNWSLPPEQHERSAMMVTKGTNATFLTVTMVEGHHVKNVSASAASAHRRILRFSLMSTPVRPIQSSRADLVNPKISPATGWFTADGEFNADLIAEGALADPGPLSALAGDVSMALWIRIDGTSVDRGNEMTSLHIAGSSYLSVGIQFSSQIISLSLLDELGDNHVVNAVSHELLPDAWIHVTISAARGKIKIFVAGKPVYSGAMDFTFQSGPSQFMVGGRWHGAVADLRIMSCGLSAADVKSLWSQGTVSERINSATIGRWSFELADSIQNNSYSASLWPSLAKNEGNLALVLNDQQQKSKAHFSPGVVVAGPSINSSLTWALQLQQQAQMTGNVYNRSELEYLKYDLHFDFVIVWESWSDVWGLPGFGEAGGPYRASLRKLIAEAHKIGLKALLYIDVSKLSEKAPGFGQIYPHCKLPGNHSPANFSNQRVHTVAVSRPEWNAYWNSQLQKFVDEFPEVDGFYCDETGLQVGINDENGRADYNLAGSRALFAKMYEIVHAKGMILIQDNSVPAVVTQNYRTDILLTGEIHYMLLQYRNLTRIGGRPLLDRVAPAMAQSWWTPARANIPVVFDTKPPGRIIHFNGGTDCPSFRCGWDRQKVITTRELETVSALHGMSLWGPVGTNADGTSWTWWLAMDSVGCHGASTRSTVSTCQFHGYWEQHASHVDSMAVSYFVIRRAGLAAIELLLLVANYGEVDLPHATVDVPVAPTTGAWKVRQMWPVGATVATAGSTLEISSLQKHALAYVHLAQDQLPATRHKTDDSAGPGSVRLLRSRFVAAMLPPPTSRDAMQLRQAASQVAGSLGPDGAWSDVNYVLNKGMNAQSWWQAGVHLQRTIILATAARLDAPFAEQAQRALRYWLKKDILNSNWWWNWIGTPRAVAKTMLLLDQPAMQSLLASAMPIMRRSNYSHPGNPNEATNLVWMAGTRAMVGSLIENVSEIKEAYVQICSTIELPSAINANGEGLQQDGSYHQHGPQLYSGWGYGAIATGQLLFFGSVAENTPYQFTHHASAGLSKMIVDGQRWMVAGPNFDFSTCGRLMSYFVNATGPAGINEGHYHYFAAFIPYSQAFPDFLSATLQPRRLTPLAVLWSNMLNSSFVMSLPNASVISEFAAQLQSGGLSTAVGHRHYWKSDYSVLRRAATNTSKGFMVSLRMVSSRTDKAECVNDENKQGYDLTDGVTNVYVSGREFEDIFPVIDWHRLPGTVEVQMPALASCHYVVHEPYIKRSFVGGASDGNVGVSVMDYRPGRRMMNNSEIQMRRTWFMLDRVVIVVNVGSVIGPTGNYGVSTSWDQRLLSDSPAVFARRTVAPPYINGAQTLHSGVPEIRLTDLAYLHHSDIGYVNLPTPRMVHHGAPPMPWEVVASAVNRSGSWANITQGDDHAVQKPVFTAYLDHGRSTKNATDISSFYAIVPGIAASAMPDVLSELDAHLTVRPGNFTSSVCFTAGGSNSTVEHSSEIIAPNVGTTLMASFWQSNASAKLASAGCWDIRLLSLSPSPRAVPVAAGQCSGAIKPIPNMHCDVNNSTALRNLEVANYSDCFDACCNYSPCDCWTWAPNEFGSGKSVCFLKQSKAPLLPAPKPGLWTGNNPVRAKRTNPPRPEVDLSGVVVVVSEDMGQLRMSIADPSTKLRSVTIELQGHFSGDCLPSANNRSILTIQFPGGEDAGKTVQAQCHKFASWTRSTVLKVAQRAFDYFSKSSLWIEHSYCDWASSTFALGVVEYAKVAANRSSVLAFVTAWAERFDWRICGQQVLSSFGTTSATKSTTLSIAGSTKGWGDDSCSVFVHNVEYVGADVASGPATNVTSASDCCAACKLHSVAVPKDPCKYYSFDISASVNPCRLQRRGTHPKPRTGALAGWPSGGPAPPQCDLLPGGCDGPHGANSQLCGASYIELAIMQASHNASATAEMTKHVFEVFDEELTDSFISPSSWSWVDALFMSMSTLSRLGAVSILLGRNGSQYYDLQFAHFSKSVFGPADGINTYGFFNDSTNLFYRDSRFAGSSIFWGRGNGWAFGALVAALQNGANDPHRVVYLRIFRAHALRLASLAGPDGAWRPSLLNTTEYPVAETTTTAMVVYGLAFGLNEDLLGGAQRAMYLYVVRKAWNWLATVALQPNGLVGYCQPGGGSPENNYDINSTSSFCVGQFLLAASQVAKLFPN